MLLPGSFSGASKKHSITGAAFGSMPVGMSRGCTQELVIGTTKNRRSARLSGASARRAVRPSFVVLVSAR